MKGRTWGIIVLVLFVLGVVAWQWWDRSGKRVVSDKAKDMAPRIHVANLHITDISRDEIKLESEISMTNSLPTAINADKIQYELWIDSVKVMQDTYAKPLHLPASDCTTIKLPMEVKTQKLKDVLKKFDLQNSDSADYTVKTTFEVDVPIAGRRQFTLDMTKRLPAIRKVTIQPGKIDIDKLGFKESELDMEIKIINDNAFPINLKDGKFSVTVDQDLDLEGSMQKLVSVPAKGSANVSIHMQVKTAKVPKLGWKMLFKEDKTYFKMDFTGKLVSDDMPMINNSTMKMHAEGTLNDIKELAKMNK